MTDVRLHEMNRVYGYGYLDRLGLAPKLRQTYWHMTKKAWRENYKHGYRAAGRLA